MCFLCTGRGSVGVGAPKNSWLVEADLPFWPKEEGGRGLRLHRESGQFTCRGERANLVNKFLPPRNNGTHREVNRQAL